MNGRNLISGEMPAGTVKANCIHEHGRRKAGRKPSAANPRIRRTVLRAGAANKGEVYPGANEYLQHEKGRYLSAVNSPWELLEFLGVKVT